MRLSRSSSIAALVLMLVSAPFARAGETAADAPPPVSTATDTVATAMANEQARRMDDVLRRANELQAAGSRGEAVAVLESHLERWPNDDLVRQALLSAQIAALESQIRKSLNDQARTKDLIIGDPEYEAARERSAEEVQRRLATVEYFVAQHHYPQAVDACDAILKDHPGHPAVLTIKLNILRLLNKTVADERVALLREQEVRHEEAVNEVIDHATMPHEKESIARTALVFAEDVAEADRQRMRLKLQDRIDLIQDNVEVRKVIETLFSVAGINYILLDSAVGAETLTLHLVNESIETVLATIGKQVDLRFNYSGGAVYVSSGDSDVLETEIIRINSGLTNVLAPPKLSQLAAAPGAGGQAGQQAPIDPFAAGGEEGEDQTDLEKFLAEIEGGDIIVGWPTGGDIYLDKKSNTVYVRSTPACIAEVKRLLHAIDYNNVQVLIEARFVEVTDEANREIGTRFITQGNSGDFQYGGSNNAGGLTAPPAAPPGAPAEGFAAVVTGTNLKGFPDFRVALTALETEGKADTLSEPKILTLNNATGLINLTQDVSYIESYQQQTQTNANSVQNGTVVNSSSTVLVPQLGTAQEGIELRITPSVARNSDIVTLSISPTVKQIVRLRQQPFSYQPSPDSGLIQSQIEKPEFDTRTLQTSLHVQNGQTIVLGGLIKERKEETSTGLPWFSRIPVLGYLFSTKTKSHDRRHLLIFVTAHILDPNGATIDDRVRILRDTARVMLPQDLQDQKRVVSAAPATNEAAPATGGALRAAGEPGAPAWQRGRGR